MEPASFLINAHQALTSPPPTRGIKYWTTSHECRKCTRPGLYCTKSRCATGAVALFPHSIHTPPFPSSSETERCRFSPLMNSSLCHRVIGTSHYSQSAAALSSATVEGSRAWGYLKNRSNASKRETEGGREGEWRERQRE